MPHVKRARARDHLSVARIQLSPGEGSFKSALLRLAEPLAREGVALRPLDLYGAIVNEDFLGVTRVGDDAVLFTILNPAVRRPTVSIALSGRALSVGEMKGIRILALISGPGSEPGACRDIQEDLVEVLGPEERRASLRGAASAAEAWRALKGFWKT